MVKPWEKQEHETSKAFNAFCLYRDMGADRSQSRLVEEYGQSMTTVNKWSSKFDWVKRCEAWDVEQDRVAREAQLKEISDMRKRHISVANAMLSKAAQALEFIPEDEIKPSDVVKMVEVAAKLERLSRGDAGEVIEERDGGKAIDVVQFYMPSNHRDEEPEEIEK